MDPTRCIDMKKMGECKDNKSSMEKEEKEKKKNWVSSWKLIIFNVEDNRKQVGGWRTTPFFIGNEFCGILATVGLLFNLILYLVEVYHMKPLVAANILNIVWGSSSMVPLIGGFIADSYLGRFLTILIGNVINLMGMLLLLASAVVPSLTPKPCSTQVEPHLCQQASPSQLLVIYMGFFLIVIALGAIRPCNYTFGADQFNQRTKEERKDFQSYTNYYFVAIYAAILVAATLIVYIQQDVDWGWGFFVPVLLMFGSLILFIIGMKRYRYVPPQGSPLTSLAKVVVSAFHKRHMPLPSSSDLLFLGAPSSSTTINNADLDAPLPHTKLFRFLDKAAIVAPGDIGEDGSIKREWRLCPIGEVEKVKTLIRIIPIWIAGMFHAMALSQQNSFVVLQANAMDRKVAGKFKMPAGSIGVFSMIALIIWLPFYDRVVLPIFRRVTGNERGVSFLKRIGCGYLVAALSMLMGGWVESKRRGRGRSNGLHGPAPFSVFWLVPQTCLMGLAESFSAVGQTEFYYDQIPESMRSTAGSFGSVLGGLGSYLNTALLTFVHQITRRNGHDWLADNLNVAHLDYYYYLVAIILAINFLYFLVIAHWYKYKSTIPPSNYNKEEDHTTQL